MMQKCYILSALFLVCTFCFSQNLVPNPSFESVAVCPGNYSRHASEFKVIDWRSANNGTPDYFHECSRGDADVPHNWAGISEAFDGDGYAGIYVWIDLDLNYREYLQCKLVEPLIKDSTYLISFRYKLSSYSRYAVERIGLALSDSLVYQKDDRVIPASPSISIVKDTTFSPQTGSWELAEQKIKATGGEQFLIIGNFFNNITTQHYRIRFSPMQQEMLERGAYYYIDDVQVFPLWKLPEPVLPPFTPDTIVFNKTYVLNKIQFKFDSFKLQHASFEELDALASWLNNNSSVYIRLSGHTDDIGGDHYNQTLSEKRAQTVALYLQQKGIPAYRIQTKGYGKSKPLVLAADDLARKQNRRVEIVFE